MLRGKQSQRELLLAHLKSGRSITPLEALMKYGIFRLAARIWDLRNQGYLIDQEIVVDQNNKKYSRYWLAERSNA